MEKLTNNSPNKIGRRKFCACITVGTLAMATPTLAGCKTNPKAKLASTASPTLSISEVTQLKKDGYFNHPSYIIFYRDGNYKAYTSLCPHKAGRITAQSPTSAQCQKHTVQFYDINDNAKGQGPNVTQNLTSYSAKENADGSLTIS